MVIETAPVDLDEITRRSTPGGLPRRPRPAPSAMAGTRDVADVVYVRPDSFHRRSTTAIANEVGTSTPSW